jgi:hypothetical protein
MGKKHHNKRVLNKDPKNFDHVQLRYIYRRILKRIKDKPKGYFQLARLRGACGVWYYDDCIKIDPRKEIIPTIIHEVLHDLFPNNWEGWTLRLESKIINILKPYDIFKLLQAFFTKLDIMPVKRTKFKKKKIKKKIL